MHCLNDTEYVVVPLAMQLFLDSTVRIYSIFITKLFIYIYITIVFLHTFNQMLIFFSPEYYKANV